MHKRQLITICISLIIIGVLGRLYYRDRQTHQVRVDAVGKVTFTFNGLPPHAPVFNAPDVKPGDCYIRVVTAKNEGKNIATLGVRATLVNNPNHFDRVLFTSITADNVAIYGGSAGPQTLRQFFKDTVSSYLPLAVVKPGKSKSFQFTVCLPSTIGNEYQQARLVYDLAFSGDPYTCPKHFNEGEFPYHHRLDRDLKDCCPASFH